MCYCLDHNNHGRVAAGNGICSNYRDFCQCYTGYQGNDCSQRRCLYGLAFVDSPNGDLNHDGDLSDGFGDSSISAAFSRPTGTTASTALNPMYRPKGWWERHPQQLYGADSDKTVMVRWVRKQEGHFYSECSSRGICDRESGICQCFTGYEGGACNRTVCANDCSGHGSCESLREASETTTDYRMWDADKNFGCDCDAEYEGADCSLRRCYKNDDPLTVVTSNKGWTEKLSEAGEVQRIKVACANDGDVVASSQLKLSYTDVQFGEVYTTGLLTVGAANTAAVTTNAAAIQVALRALPNDVLGSTDGYNKVTVTGSSLLTNGKGFSYMYYYVTFDTSLGNVPIMTANTDAMVCKAGIVYPTGDHGVAGHYLTGGTNDWYAGVTWAYDTVGVTTGPAIDTTVTLVSVTASAAAEFSYLVTVAGTPTAITGNKVAFTAGPQYIADDMDDLFPMKFTASEGLGHASLAPYGAATATFTTQFTAGAAAVVIETPQYTISTTLPITYGMVSKSGTDAEILYIERSSPYRSITGTFTTPHACSIQFTAASVYTWDDPNAVARTAKVPVDGWQVLSGAIKGTDPIYHFKFAFTHGVGDGTKRPATAAFPLWNFNLFPGIVSMDESAASAETLTVAWVGATYPVERVDIVIYVVAKNGDLAAGNSDYYGYTYNGVEQGTHGIPAAAATLGSGTLGKASDVVLFTVLFGGAAAVDANRAVSVNKWRFRLTLLPIQAVWGYLETSFKAIYFDATYTTAASPVAVLALTEASRYSGRLFAPTSAENVGFVLNWVDVSSTPDKYRWKLSTDEEWIGTVAAGKSIDVGTASDSGVNSETFILSGKSSNSKHDRILKWVFELSTATTDGLDVSDRACDTSTNSYYYIQTGSEGINDFGECSDRGLCNRETGECECFKGYKGTDCSLQSALAF